MSAPLSSSPFLPPQLAYRSAPKSHKPAARVLSTFTPPCRYPTQDKPQPPWTPSPLDHDFPFGANTCFDYDQSFLSSPSISSDANILDVEYRLDPTTPPYSRRSPPLDYVPSSVRVANPQTNNRNHGYGSNVPPSDKESQAADDGENKIAPKKEKAVKLSLNEFMNDGTCFDAGPPPTLPAPLRVYAHR